MTRMRRDAYKDYSKRAGKASHVAPTGSKAGSVLTLGLEDDNRIYRSDCPSVGVYQAIKKSLTKKNADHPLFGRCRVCSLTVDVPPLWHTAVIAMHRYQIMQAN